MPKSDAFNKTDRLQQLQLLFWHNQGKRYRTKDIAHYLDVSVDTASLYLNELSADGRLPIISDHWDWYLPEDARYELLPLKLTLPEATSLYLAGRLLVMTQNQHNQHVMSALTKLVAVMPLTVAPHQHQLLKMLKERQQAQKNISHIFEALAIGWATHRLVRLRYTPPDKRTFECDFAPYLLEPSGIGHTVYAIGKSSTPHAFRTYKLERIEQATMTDKNFEIEQDFDGPTLLKRAWGVMYGDEEVFEVHLRFSHLARKRLKETLWHPTQEIIDTPDGCEWKAQIGDTLEIENWIRGWGEDCEVIAPQPLRQRMIDTARRLAGMYGVEVKPVTSLDTPNVDLLRQIYGE
ncbi:MAG: WYL domain-containing protein [Ktedonobacteraceae bacterium]